MARPAAPADRKQAALLEARLTREAPRFDLCALLDLLHELGYPDGEIEYRSHQTTLHQSAVIAAVSFQQVPRRVVITVNQGWLAPQTALPSYFLKVLAHQQEESLSEFLNFFCHQLLDASRTGMFPERDETLFRDWQMTRRQLRSLLGLRSLSTIHWVFGLVFPEMEVSVQRTVLPRTVRTRGMILGSWVIGDGATCGGTTVIPVSAVAVTLLCDEPVSGTGRPWAGEATRRLHAEVFPGLTDPGLFLQVVLVLRDQASYMVLKADQYLGYEPLAKGALSAAPGRKLARSIVLWNGEVPRPVD